MRRRLNFTERKKIPRSCVLIEIKGESSKNPEFEALVDLEGLGFPSEARVFLEAHHGSSYRRFEFGKVSSIDNPANTSLSEMGYLRDLLFRIKVVDDSGLLIGSGDKIRPAPAGEEKVESILPVRFQDLERMIWEIEIDEIQGPKLLINSRIEGIQEKAKFDPKFFCFVYPVALREVLIRWIFQLKNRDPESEWQRKWTIFAKKLAGDFPDIWEEDEGLDEEGIMDWIEIVVREFSNKRRDIWNEYIKESSYGN